MFRLCAKIEIKGDRSWSFDFANAVEITRDMEKLTTEAKITMPKKVKWDGADEIPVKRGDTVTVSLGYDGNLQTAFAGYVRDVGFKTPIVITCEDDMFKLKQMPAQKKAYRSVTLETLLKDQGINYRLNIMGEQALGAYRVTANTVAALLGKLSEQGVRSFFRYEDGEPVLYCGVLFGTDYVFFLTGSSSYRYITLSYLDKRFNKIITHKYTTSRDVSSDIDGAIFFKEGYYYWYDLKKHVLHCMRSNLNMSSFNEAILFSGDSILIKEGCEIKKYKERDFSQKSSLLTPTIIR